MDHKNIPLDPEDLKKLRRLLKEEESKVDDMSDEELLAAEKALEVRVKKISTTLPLSQAGDEEKMTAIWQKIDKTGPVPAVLSTEIESDGGAIPIGRKKKSLPWATMSVLAAAAVALLIFYPKIQPQNPDLPFPDGTQIKGTGNEQVFQSFCDIDVVGLTKESVEEAGNGRGYDVRRNENFQMTLLCDHTGFVQIWSKGAPATELRNIPVTAKIRSAIIQDGKPFDFNLRGSKDVLLGISLTAKEIGKEVDLFEVSIPAKSLGKSKLLWSDSIAIRGRDR